MHFIPFKKEPSNYSKCSAFASFFAFLHLFFNSNSVSFVEDGRKNYPREQGTLATPLAGGRGHLNFHTWHKYSKEI